MKDDQLTARRAIADLSYLTSAGAFNYGAVALISADANITNTGANTGYKSFGEGGRNPIITPMALEVVMPGISLAGGMTTTGAPTAAALDLTLTFSDDGTNQVGQTITARVQNVTIASNAGVLVTRSFIRLPAVKHAYYKVAWASTLTGGTSPTAAWGPLGLYLVNQPDDLNGVTGTDIG